MSHEAVPLAAASRTCSETANRQRRRDSLRYLHSNSLAAVPHSPSDEPVAKPPLAAGAESRRRLLETEAFGV